VSITNGFDPNDLKRVRDERRREDRPFKLVYTGSVTSYYDLEPFWIAVRQLADRGVISPQTFQIEFVGNLSPSDVERHGLSSFVQLKPFVPHDGVFDVFASADALLMIEAPLYYRYTYAAKLFDYMLTGKPIVALVESVGNSALLLERLGVGHCAEPDDVADIERALLEALKQKGAPPKVVDPDAAPFREFNRKYLVERLATVLDDAVSEAMR
jgi:glycosyltransferase involved in cell wall biosynthesis